MKTVKFSRIYTVIRCARASCSVNVCLAWLDECNYHVPDTSCRTRPWCR